MKQQDPEHWSIIRVARNRAAWCLAAWIGALSPLAVIAMLTFLGSEAAGFFGAHSPTDLLSFSWRPVVEDFGLIPLASSTSALAFLVAGPVMAFGTAAAIRLVFFAGRAEQVICEMALTVMAGLPSVIVGLAGLAWVTPRLGFSLAAGGATLFLMIFPVFTLLLAAALREEGGRLWDSSRALGFSRRQFAWRIAVRAVLPALATALALAVGKAMGEATAVSLVIGNITDGSLPDILGPANTLTTAILKDHPAATGTHHAALYVAAISLSAMVLAVNLAGMATARVLRRRTS